MKTAMTAGEYKTMTSQILFNCLKYHLGQIRHCCHLARLNKALPIARQNSLNRARVEAREFKQTLVQLKGLNK